jgi:hypothetical protein
MAGPSFAKPVPGWTHGFTPRTFRMSQILQRGICKVSAAVTGQACIRGVPVYNLNRELVVLIDIFLRLSRGSALISSQLVFILVSDSSLHNIAVDAESPDII